MQCNLLKQLELNYQIEFVIDLYKNKFNYVRRNCIMRFFYGIINCSSRPQSILILNA